MHMYALSDVTQKEGMMPLLGLVTLYMKLGEKRTCYANAGE